MAHPPKVLLTLNLKKGWMKKGDKEKGIRYYVPSSYMERLKKLSYEVSQFKHKNLFTITQ